MKETLDESAPAYSTVTQWYDMMNSSCEDSHCCGRQSTAVNEETGYKLVINDRRLSVDFIAESVGSFTDTAFSILIDIILLMKKSLQFTRPITDSVFTIIHL